METPNHYSRNCSCCGEYISKEQMDFLIETEQADTEGNYCSQCYYDIDRKNHHELLELASQIESAMSTPIRKFKWQFQPWEQKVNFIFKCIDKKLITFQIGE